ncbi:MAG: PRC-barrel domain-containing protein [Methylocella sp.]
MRSMIIGLVAAAALSSAAFAQSLTPAAIATYANVSDDAVLSYNLVGLHVQDIADHTVGEIKDVVLEKGQLVGYIVWVGGSVGLGDRYVLVEAASVGLTWEDADHKWKAVINASKDDLAAAPEFKYQGKFKH